LGVAEGQSNWLEHPAVISEATFCQFHSSFWQTIAPTTDLFIRRLNTGLYERDFSPMKTETVPGRRGFVNECAFAMFCRSIRAGEKWPFSIPTINEVWNTSMSVRTLGQARDQGQTEQLTRAEIEDAREQHERMMCVFTADISIEEVVPEPVFPGCGFIDRCHGDVLVSKTLFEVKAGDRLFRSIDVRQLVTYAALNLVARQHKIHRVGLFNPRLGIRTVVDIDELCFEVSGKDAITLLSEIVVAISSGETSR
jgi:hypothetical protein